MEEGNRQNFLGSMLKIRYYEKSLKMSDKPTGKGPTNSKSTTYTFSSIQSDPGPGATIFLRLVVGKLPFECLQRSINILC